MYAEVTYNAVPTIDPANIVGISSPISPTYGDVTPVSFSFIAEDLDGVGDLVDTSAYAEFQGPGGPNVGSCNPAVSCPECLTNEWKYDCSVDMNYYDIPGTWTVYVEIQDVAGETASDSSVTFTYNEVVYFDFLPTSFSWGTLAPGLIDQLATNNPMTMDNLGNANLGIEITAANLVGEITPEEIPANQFSVNTDSLCGGDVLSDGTPVSITGASLPGGLGSQEQAYFCLEQVPSVPAQLYSANQAGGNAWEVTFTALFAAFAVRRRKKRKKIKDENLLEVLDEKLEELDVLKESIKELSGIVRARELEKRVEDVEVPISIFSQSGGAAELLCKYLKENKGLKFSEIARLLERDRRTVGTNYKNSRGGRLKVGGEGVSVSVFSDRRLSVLESLVYYLRGAREEEC